MNMKDGAIAGCLAVIGPIFRSVSQLQPIKSILL
jgi:hypothetical protein